MACSPAQMEKVKAAAAAAGPCVVDEIQAYDEWKAPAYLECASGVLLWGQLHTVMQGFLETELDTPLGPRLVEQGCSTILQHAFRYRAPARKGRWKIEAFSAGYVCHHVDADGPDLLRRAAPVGKSLTNDHADRDIVYVNRYDWSCLRCPDGGHSLMTELMRPEKKPKEKKLKPKGNHLGEKEVQGEEDEDDHEEEVYDEDDDKDDHFKDVNDEGDSDHCADDDHDEFMRALIMNRFMLVDEQGFPQFVQSIRDGFKLDTKNYLFRKGNAETPLLSSEAFGVTLGMGGGEYELGWLAFQDGELVGFVYDGAYCFLEGDGFYLGDTKVEIPRKPAPLDSEDESEEGKEYKRTRRV